MKNISKLLMVFIALCFVKISYSQVYNVEFSNGVKDKVEVIDNDYLSGYKRYLTVTPLGFRGGILEPNGPFALDLAYIKFFNNMDNAFEGKFYFCPIDFQILEGFDGYKAFPMSIDLQYRIKIKSKSRFKNRTVTINLGGKAEYDKSAREIIYRVKIPLKEQVNYYLRLGGFYNQYTWGEEYTLSDSSNLKLDAVKSYSLYVGISKTTLGYFDFKSNRFGRFNFSWMSELYLDIMYAPVFYGLGTHTTYYDSQTHSGGEIINDKHLKSSCDELQKYRSGFRIGGSRKYPIRGHKMMTEYKFEFAYYPGYEWQFYYFGVGYGLTFGK